MFWFLPIIFGSMLAGGAAGLAIGFISSLFIDESTIIEEIHQRAELKDAFKAIIKSKTTRTVNLNIFDYSSNEIGTCEIESNKGVSDQLYVGQTIYM